MTRWIYPDHLNNALETGAIGVDQVTELTRILKNRPAVIVTASRSVTPQNPGSTALMMRVTNRDYRRCRPATSPRAARVCKRSTTYSDGRAIGTPASIIDRQPPHTVAIEDEPLDSVMSDRIRMV